MRPGFGYEEAAAVAGYLSRLGVSHIYTSPYLQPVPGSTHGYDVIDHRRINGDLGDDAAHLKMRQCFRDLGLRQIIDLVPNHMAVNRVENVWWWDVLENGRSSRFASYFDVDWDPPERKLRDTVLLPVLADHYGRVLEAGELTLERESGRLRLRHGTQLFPISPRTLGGILTEAGLTDLAAEVEQLPHSHEDSEESIRERHERKERLALEIGQRLETDPTARARVDAAIARVSANHDDLDELISRQNYRLAFWRTASRELDYRRFFDITDLVALRLEREHVFEDTHELVLSWATSGEIDGIRVDHPDGLRDPEEYFERLSLRTPETWVLAEKILQSGENLPQTWPIAGTTGYDFMNLVTGLFVDPASEEHLTTFYGEFIGDKSDYARVLYRAKHDVMRGALAADLERLTIFFVRICEQNRRYRDYTRHELREVLRETVACFPTYRSYVRAESGVVRDADIQMGAIAIDEAKRRRPDLDQDLFELLRDILLLKVSGETEAGLVMRLQQYTAPVTAKGAEDTAFYRYNRLVALNEVGGDPGRFGISVEEFHQHNARTLKDWPETMLSGSTHDTKRSEDVRLRMALLSQAPLHWTGAVLRWSESNQRHRSEDPPDRNLEYLYYQTLIGAHPLTPERALQYLEKAAREAKRYTSWYGPNEEYESAVEAFVRGCSDDQEFMREVVALVAQIAPAGWIASLGQALLRLTSPGVPDIYQGCELWDDSLVDPDNRRPVDFALRERLLTEMDQLDVNGVLARSAEGLPKLLLISRALDLRQRRPEAFAGSYEPLSTVGPRANDLIAYCRGGEVCVVVPRFIVGRPPWTGTEVVLPAGAWRDVNTDERRDGGRSAVGEVLERFPVALLERA